MKLAPVLAFALGSGYAARNIQPEEPTTTIDFSQGFLDESEKLPAPKPISDEEYEEILFDYLTGQVRTTLNQISECKEIDLVTSTIGPGNAEDSVFMQWGFVNNNPYCLWRLEKSVEAINLYSGLGFLANCHIASSQFNIASTDRWNSSLVVSECIRMDESTHDSTAESTIH